MQTRTAAVAFATHSIQETQMQFLRTVWMERHLKLAEDPREEAKIRHGLDLCLSSAIVLFLT